MTERHERRHAALLAVTEVLPGEWRDLSDLVEREGLGWLDGLSSSDHARSGSDLATYLRGNLDEGRVDHWLKVVDRLVVRCPGVRMVTMADDDYPKNLRTVYDRPPFLFVKGTIVAADELAVAIVGSRKADDSSLDAAGALARELVASGVTIVSGLADGIDTAAHLGALEVPDGRTTAVLGTGIDLVYPQRNAGLAETITGRGAIVSQFRPGSPPTKSTFPMRNAVIAGVSRGSVLVTASERSGTRSEAEHSLRLGRPVLLWRPALGGQPWAREFVARHERANFVASAQEVLDHTGLAGAQPDAR